MCVSVLFNSGQLSVKSGLTRDSGSPTCFPLSSPLRYGNGVEYFSPTALVSVTVHKQPPVEVACVDQVDQQEGR